MTAIFDEQHRVAAEALAAIRGGEVERLAALLDETPALATACLRRVGPPGGVDFVYPLLMAAVDYPARFPRVAETIARLVSAGADVNAHASGPHRETALHFAASADDVVALDALLDAGAELEAPGAVIAGGTALDDAVAFRQWKAARRLVERGARPALWHAAALGLVDEVEGYFGRGRPRAPYPWGGVSSEAEINVAFWCACHGGQRACAELLLERGARLDWVAPWDGMTPLAAARRAGENTLVEWLLSLGAKSAG